MKSFWFQNGFNEDRWRAEWDNHQHLAVRSSGFFAICPLVDLILFHNRRTISRSKG